MALDPDHRLQSFFLSAHVPLEKLLVRMDHNDTMGTRMVSVVKPLEHSYVDPLVPKPWQALDPTPFMSLRVLCRFDEPRRITVMLLLLLSYY